MTGGPNRPGEQAAAYERRCRRLLRAYPRRWRARYGDELLGLLLDTAPPGVTRPGARTTWDVVRSGWSWRLRHRPPLWRWVLWRMYDVVPRGHRSWARDDVEGALYPLRTNWLPPLFVLVLPGILGALTNPSGVPGYLAMIIPWWAAGSVAGMLLWGASTRAMARRKIDPEVPEPRTWWDEQPAGTGPRRRAAPGTWLTSAWCGAGTLAVVVWWVGAGHRGDGLARVALALLAGLLLATAVATVVTLRTSRSLPPCQPHRRLARPHGVLTAAALGMAAYVGLFGATRDTTWVVDLTVFAALAALATVPVAATVDLLARLLLRRRPDLRPAVRDVVLLALGRTPRTDPPQPVWQEPDGVARASAAVRGRVSGGGPVRG
ncbi:hypothetical protein [Thalassiella azotivora]